jgi:NitT/TauT family transport system substrate-binding protein
MTNILKGFLAFAVVGVLIFPLVSCKTKTEPQEIKIGYLPYSSALSFFVAYEKGYFSDEGLQVKPIKVASANEAMDALKAGDLDFVMGVGLSTCFALEGASPGSFKCFQPCVEDSTHTVSYLLIPKDSPIKNVLELKGKKVGTYSGTSQVLVLRLLLQEIGLDPDDPKEVRMGDVESRLQVDAFAAGQFDAFLTLEPYATKIMELHGGKPLVKSPRTKYILDPFPAGSNVVSTGFLKDYPDATSKVIKALDRAIINIHQDEAGAKALLPKYDKTLTPDMAVKTGIYKWWTTDETDIKPIQEYADLLFEGGAIKNKVDVKEMFVEESNPAKKG